MNVPVGVRRRARPAPLRAGGLGVRRGRWLAPAVLLAGLCVAAISFASPAAAVDGPRSAGQLFDIKLLSFKPPRAVAPEFQKPDPKAQKTTESGLKYEVLEAGSGEVAKPAEKVVFDYTFWNTAGKLMQTSAHADQPTTVPLNQLTLAML